nr:hypothetical protein [Tanacetum cinerariifolium]
MGAISQKKCRLCLYHLGRFCVSSGTQESKEKQRDVLPTIHKSHHSSFHDEETFNPKTQQDIRNTKAYKEYYACATRKAAPKPKASDRRKRGGSVSSTTPLTPIATPTPITTVVAAPRLTAAAAKGKQPARATSLADPSDVERTEAEQLKIILRRSRHETHISQQEISKIDEQEATESGEGADEETKSDEESKEEETTKKEEESFDPIPKTLEESEDDGNGGEDQGGSGLQVSQDIEDSHVTLTPTHSDGQQESSSTSSFMTNLLNPIINPDRVKSLEVNFSEFMWTNQSQEAVSNIPGNKSIQRSDEQRNLYKALVDAYEVDKTILDFYRESAILKRRREDDDDQEGPSAGSDRGSKRRREGGEHASTSTLSEPATG